MDAADEGGEAAATANSGLNGAPPPFLSKTYEMVDDPATDAVVSWGAANNSFVVWNPPEFARDLLPKYFKHSNFSSFIRQLNTYGFRKVDPDRWEFANEGFLRGQKQFLVTINRRKSTHTQKQQQQPQTQNATEAACVEVGKFGLEEEIEQLKRDKNVLMQEHVRLRQQQQSGDHQLKILVQRLQGMEHRQQQMMSFLVKAMQRPGFLSQLVQQNDSNRRITGVGKKRKYPDQESSPHCERTSLEDQIVKYEPLINEAAKAMLRQILKNGTTSDPRLESLSNSANSLNDNLNSSPETFNNKISSGRHSGVILSEASSASGVPCSPAASCYSTICSSPAPSEIQSSECTVTTEMSNMNLEHFDTCITGFSAVQCMGPGGKSTVFQNASHNIPMAGSNYINHIPESDGLVRIEAEKLPSDDIMDTLNEDEKLPGINDPLWEDFLAASPLSAALEGVDSSKN